MRVVDTSAWIEWLIKSPTGATVAAALPPNANWLAPTIVQFELAKWVRRERGEEKSDQAIAFSATCVVVPLDTSIAVAAARVSAEHKLPLADAIVYATARAYDADLLTCDAHFKDLPHVILIEKQTP
ncbi:MAG: type II toxin-antitoxin system VapC family toxin [Hyphomonadaceae bacterium]